MLQVTLHSVNTYYILHSCIFDLTVFSYNLRTCIYIFFRYERHYDEQKNSVIVKMAQSYSGACEGLWSAEEGDRTYTLWTGTYVI